MRAVQVERRRPWEGIRRRHVSHERRGRPANPAASADGQPRPIHGLRYEEHPTADQRRLRLLRRRIDRARGGRPPGSGLPNRRQRHRQRPGAEPQDRTERHRQPVLGCGRRGGRNSCAVRRRSRVGEDRLLQRHDWADCRAWRRRGPGLGRPEWRRLRRSDAGAKLRCGRRNDQARCERRRGLAKDPRHVPGGWSRHHPLRQLRRQHALHLHCRQRAVEQHRGQGLVGVHDAAARRRETAPLPDRSGAGDDGGAALPRTGHHGQPHDSQDPRAHWRRRSRARVHAETHRADAAPVVRLDLKLRALGAELHLALGRDALRRHALVDQRHLGRQRVRPCHDRRAHHLALSTRAQRGLRRSQKPRERARGRRARLHRLVHAGREGAVCDRQWQNAGDRRRRGPVHAQLLRAG